MTNARYGLLALCAVALAACGGGNDSTSTPGPRTARGAITDKTALGATVRFDDNPSTADLLENGMIVTVKGTFDDRGGHVTEIEYEHQLEGRVDDKGTDFVTIGGARVQVDDTVHYEDRVASLDAIGIGSVVAVSGAPVAPLGADDKGGLRASRIDAPSFGDDQRVDVKGFVSSLVAGTSFELRLTPEATSWYEVDVSGLSTIDGTLVDGAYVEVITSVAPVAGVPPVIASLRAHQIHVEDRFGQAEVEIEGYVTTVAGNDFYVDGVPVRVDAGTVYLLGTKNDLAVGVKVEAEGSLDASGLLHAGKVSFRPGVRLTAIVQNVTSTDMTMLGIPVQLPSYLDLNGLALTGKIEIRGTPKADGSGIVALRLAPDSSGNASRALLRAVATGKSASASSPTFTVFGFTASGTGATVYRDANGTAISASAFHGLVEPNRTVIKIRADNAATDVDSGAKTWIADELQIED
jgi:Domain of unknown function (DUF5666)